MMYIDNSVNYDKPSSVIYDFQVIVDIIQKSGMKYIIVNPSNKILDRDDRGKDVEKRYLFKRPHHKTGFRFNIGVNLK